MVAIPNDLETGLLQPKNVRLTAAVEVKPMRYADIPKAARSSCNAIRDVDLNHYFEDVPVCLLLRLIMVFSHHQLEFYPQNAGSPSFRERRQKIILSLNYGNAIRRHQALTVDRGEANCDFGPAKESPDVIDKIVDYIVRCLRVFTTDEQRKRRQEFSMKVSALVRSALGDRVADMIEIHSLATSPAKQGRGYGSALADAEGRATWLITSDAYKFYESVGFSVAAACTLGEDNPTWNKPPIVIRVMVREAHGERQQSEKS
ncbi:hypothetical protein A0H81_03767 [Grifola frondosa]|uniref:N-acetyltransferase domain-containing protein n=1 Tax=Grifola frondosa TaxID=5627 RepID=A0A1C7MI38_GRIFR|nr:hypothetical protein A0H81_03767 [Grifola frondosa]